MPEEELRRRFKSFTTIDRAVRWPEQLKVGQVMSRTSSPPLVDSGEWLRILQDPKHNFAAQNVLP